MFTGLITDLGTITRSEMRGDLVLAIDCGYEDLAVGESVACNGVCLTVVEAGNGNFQVSLSAETLVRTKSWNVGDRLNLERALKLSDRLGGHLVSGHVDGVAKILHRKESGDSVVFGFEASADLAKFIAAKGSVALDGISLTVNEVNGHQFSANLIPHTLSMTTAGGWQPGASVHLEVDMMARYAERLMHHD